MKTPFKKLQLVFVCLFSFILPVSLSASDKPAKNKKLKIVFMMGQSNMVGYAAPHTAWYITQPAYVPPAKLGTFKPRYFNWNHYWKGVANAVGSKEYMA